MLYIHVLYKYKVKHINLFFKATYFHGRIVQLYRDEQSRYNSMGFVLQRATAAEMLRPSRSYPNI